MVKRLSLLTVIMLICVMACSCAASSDRTLPNTNNIEIPVTEPQPENSDALDIALDINKGIYDLSHCLPGFLPTIECNTFQYRLEDIHLSLNVYDKATPVEDIYPGDTDSYEKRTESGMDYYFRTDSIFWDGIDEETGEATGGKMTTAEILFYIDEYMVVLNGNTENGDVSAVTLKLTLELLSKTPINGLEQLGGSLFTRLHNGTLECNISLITKDNAEYQNIFNAEGTVIEEQDNIRYLASISERSPDDPNMRFVVCDTDKGALLISCGVPYSERNNEPAEELDFINSSLAQKVAERLGVVITSISK